MSYNPLSNPDDIACLQAVVLDGKTHSKEQLLNGWGVIGIICPATLTGTVMNFQAAINDSGWFDLYDEDGTQVAVTYAASRYIALKPYDFPGFHKIKLAKASAASGADETYTLVVKKLQ